ncbi:MAG: hypothetical protein Q7V05_16290 [Methanoregula sp.]|nr:hypothetical protein [Methanoregula sp.]
MEQSEPVMDKEHKIKDLEQDLNDLRQGLAVVTDYYKDLKTASKEQVVSLELEEAIVKPLMEDELEFDGIWSFHEEVLVADYSAHVPCTAMYEAFVKFCTRSGRRAIEQEAFEFVFERMENPKPICERGNWIGYRLRTAK